MLVVPRKFPYNASYKKMILGGVIAAVAAYALAQMAMTNDRGLSIDYIINLDTTGATIFDWACAGFCAVGCLISIAAMANTRFSPKELKIDENEIIIPYGFFQSNTRRIGYGEITGLSETTVSRQTLLYLHTPSGKVAILESHLPSKDDYEDVKQFLVRKSEVAGR